MNIFEIKCAICKECMQLNILQFGFATNHVSQVVFKKKHLVPLA